MGCAAIVPKGPATGQAWGPIEPANKYLEIIFVAQNLLQDFPDTKLQLYIGLWMNNLHCCQQMQPRMGRLGLAKE